MRLLLRVIFEAVAFMYVLPMVGGISFHGNFVQALGLAIFFTLMLWVVEVLSVALSAYLAVTTLGLALLVLIPLWILGFWILPAVALKFVADFMPGYLGVSGWVPAILGGLILLLIGMVTGSMTALSKGYNRSGSAPV